MFNREALEQIVRVHPDSFPARKLLENFAFFEGIHEALNGKWIYGWGSYLFDGVSYDYNPRCLKKQEELYRYSMTATHAVEVGVYVGHSLLLMLLANPSLTITAIDCDDTYAGPVVAYLNRHFQNRVTFLKGDAVEIMRTLPPKSFDLVHIDADHNDAAVHAQFHESTRIATDNATYVFDDYDAVSATINNLVYDGYIRIKVIPDCLWRNCVATLTARNPKDGIVAVASKYSCCSKERLSFNIDAITSVNDRKIVGDIVEIGVYKGGSMIAMMRADTQGRTFFLYDTYEGMTAPTDADYDFNGYSAAHLMNTHESVKCISSLKEVQENVGRSTRTPADKLHYIVGDIMKTTQYPEKIAVLRLDTDFYDSTKFELDNFYDRVSPGGIVIIDDYGHWKGCRKAVDEFLTAHTEITLTPIDYTGVYFQKPAHGHH